MECLLISLRKLRWHLAQVVEHTIVVTSIEMYYIDSDDEGGLHCQPVLPMKFLTHCFFLTHRCLALGLTSSIHTYRETIREHNEVRERERERERERGYKLCSGVQVGRS